MYLGLAFGAGIPMAFAAQIELVPKVAWLLLLSNVLWVTVYDTMYAMVDRNDDIRIGVKSTAILFGDSDRHIIAVLQLMTLVVAVSGGKNDSREYLVQHRTDRRRGVLYVSVMADPGARPRWLFPRLPQ